MASLGGTGIWSHHLRHDPAEEIAEAVAELEQLGYSAVWIPDIGGDVFAALDHLLDSSSTMTIATGILNVWMHTASDTAAWWRRLPDDRRRRVLVGLGISHAPIVGDRFGKPLATFGAYLDELDEEGVPAEARCLAALGPKMLELSRDRSAGAHPYLVTPEHTASARETLGSDALLAVEQGVVLGTDPDIARIVARSALAGYLGLPNYVNNFRRMGFTEDDFANGGSDRLVDEIIAWGDVDTVAARIRQHRDAGADHVCVQVHTAPGSPMPRALWRDLAAAVV
jgi:probable F420-dependent oxidoreductase